MSEQPVTFEALKQIIGHCRNGADLPHLPYPSHCLSENCIRCRLEALEQQLRALRDEYQACQGYDSIVKRLTALLGKPCG